MSVSNCVQKKKKKKAHIFRTSELQALWETTTWKLFWIEAACVPTPLGYWSEPNLTMTCTSSITALAHACAAHYNINVMSYGLSVNNYTYTTMLVYHYPKAVMPSCTRLYWQPGMVLCKNKLSQGVSGHCRKIINNRALCHSPTPSEAQTTPSWRLSHGRKPSECWNALTLEIPSINDWLISPYRKFHTSLLNNKPFFFKRFIV